MTSQQLDTCTSFEAMNRAFGSGGAADVRFFVANATTSSRLLSAGGAA